MRPATYAQDAGFTLVEALVATLLMSIIVAALATVTAQWLPNWNRGVARLQSTEVVALGLDRISDDLAAAAFVSADPDDKVPIFDGAELSVTFVRSALAPNVANGLEVVRIMETSDDSGPFLVRTTAPLPVGTGKSAEALVFSNPVSLIRAPFRISFSYAGPDRIWHAKWRDEAQLPRAVRVTLRDNVTSTVLAASTSTLIHAELPARCTWAQTVAACPELGGRIGAQQSSDSGAIGAR